MLKKISIAIFWLAFFGLFLFMLIPKYKYLTNDTLEHWGSKSTFDNSIFALHILAGIIVYCTAILQFTPAIRNKYISFHRKTGKLYILASFLCITTLYVMLPRTSCVACMPSQFIVTSLWLLFVVLAFYFIKQRKIILHQRMMISSFICAAYFVTVRVIDAYAMDVFYYLFPNKSTAYLASDVFVWLVPLLLFHLYWLINDKKQSA
ncbi:MAG: DUF2306 domain-containing protein [Chitinophagaceae bacterium]|jgi:uncharacterized membrane protein YozB (DUF420 family)|nr:DUF2306 domain-containing protein [Chitinophagaceae bacterium]HQW84416.1 DUF2306 domain-containing protein [Ferruginibacter sp.]MBK7679886.1 DUF2306 domain-containing protein [Chitinophagaceae bacterium]MBK9464955.1 DUF2306 domain-containing protein [Chitinophagaceae bacterium]MBK9661456.1 DUF2306 domain-containing protein [Chitinophagaceae bacterium]